MTINEYLQKHKTIKTFTDASGEVAFAYKTLTPAVTCEDGYHVSIQASKGHHCIPAKDDCDHYESIELGFPTMADEELLEYAEDPDDPTGTVYGWVPVELVDKVLAKHGGIMEV